VGVPHVDAVVVGAGIAGLAAALELQSAGCEVLAIDPADRPGGVMRTNHWKGFVVESGPNTTLVRKPMLDFLERRHLRDALRAASPASRRRYLFRDGRMRRVPGSLAGLARRWCRCAASCAR
jgi:oxygen-dependent protoporphyrinogen oxidase